MRDSGENVKTRRDVDDPITYGIIGAAQKVHRTLGPGFKESTYQKALSKELMIRNIWFVSQPEYQVFYEGVLCGTYQPDLVVCDTVLLELKAASTIAAEHKAQTLSYLRASGLQVALLINFGAKSLEYRRFVN